MDSHARSTAWGLQTVVVAQVDRFNEWLGWFSVEDAKRGVEEAEERLLKAQEAYRRTRESLRETHTTFVRNKNELTNLLQTKSTTGWNDEQFTRFTELMAEERALAQSEKVMATRHAALESEVDSCLSALMTKLRRRFQEELNYTHRVRHVNYAVSFAAVALNGAMFFAAYVMRRRELDSLAEGLSRRWDPRGHEHAASEQAAALATEGPGDGDDLAALEHLVTSLREDADQAARHIRGLRLRHGAWQGDGGSVPERPEARVDLASTPADDLDSPDRSVRLPMVATALSGVLALGVAAFYRTRR